MESVPISRENYDYYSSTELLTEENLIKAVSEYGKNGADAEILVFKKR